MTARPDVPRPVHVAQDDLEEDDVYLLDTFTTIFAWDGSQSNEVAPTHSVVPRHSCARFLLALHT